ncbi:hypothetical protein Aduo_004165 [Ancylostoma duodenale]
MKTSSLYSDYAVFPKNHASESVKTNAPITVSMHNPNYVTRLILERFNRSRNFMDDTLRPVRYLIVPTQRYVNQLRIVIIVLSQIDDFEIRSYWRQTYANLGNQKKFGYGVIFPVGVRASADVQRQLEIEANSYGDILQADFDDSYRNLTLKMLSSLRYVSLAFHKEVVVLKIDSDVGWRIRNVTGYITTVIDTMKTAFHCYRLESSSPTRSRENKWYVAIHEYPYDLYPPYCLGWSYIATLSAINYTLQQAHLCRFLWLEDVFLTGILNRGRSASLVEMGHDKFFRTRTNISDFDGAWLFHLRGRNLSILEVYRLLNEEFRD